MNKKEATKYLNDNIEEFFDKHGFLRVKKSGVGLSYRKEEENGWSGIGIGFVDYNPIQKARFSVFRHDRRIEEIVLKVSEKVKLSTSSREEALSLAFGYYVDKEYSTEQWTSTGMVMDEDAALVADQLKLYFLESGFPHLEKYEDLREIDKMVNNLDDLWLTDWMKPFNLGGNFNVKRFIIAKLSGNPSYNDLVDRVFDLIDDEMIRQGSTERADRKSLDKPIPYTVHLLKDVEPLYDSYE